MKFFLLLSVLSFSSLSTLVNAKVEILPYRHHSWNNDWNESISSELDQKNYEVMMSDSIDENDLLELGCPGFNSMSDPELKKDFWVVFFSALTRAESGFNKKARSKSSYGLLQLSKSTARLQCGLDNVGETADSDHLRCGVKLLSWQLQGAPTQKGKLMRPDLKGQLFGKYILLWGPLRQKDFGGRKLLVNWFKKHLDQLPFCS